MRALFGQLVGCRLREFGRRCFLWGTVTAVLMMVPVISAAPADDRPNLLVILADDLGYADLQCCGAEDMETPQLDRLFASGMQFTNAYANCPVCSPTRAALLSGMYQATVGVPGVIRTHADNNWGYLDPATDLLPVAAQQAGYQTACIGKWHLGLASPNLPTERGFDHFHGFLGDMMDDYYTHRRHDINYMRRQTKEIDPAGHATDLFTEWSIEFLKTRDASRPFLLYLAWNAPHTPIQPPEDWLERVRERHPDLAPARARLVALIEHMDHGVGRVLQTLEDLGLRDDTIVVFTSDNGGQVNVGANNGQLRDGKQSVYEGGLRVPLAVSWPGRIAAGSESQLACLSMDLLPTLFDAAGIPMPDGRDGRSFLRTLLGNDQPELRDVWFFSRREGGLRYGGKTIEAVRRGPWKLLQNSPFEPQELYHLEFDPGESRNVITEHPQVARELAALLRQHIQDGGRVPWQPPN